MEFLYDFNFNDSSEVKVKEFFKKFLAECNEICHEDKNAVYSNRLVSFFGGRDNTILKLDEYGINEYAENALYSIHIVFSFDADINKSKFRFELLEDECSNEFPITEEDININLEFNEDITDVMLNEVSRAYFNIKKQLVECSEEYLHSF